MTGNKLRLLREFRNYSQEYVARKLGITQNTYSRVENNQTRVTTERLHQIAQILDVPVGELVSNDELVIHFDRPLANHHLSTVKQDDHWSELNEKIACIQSEIQGLHEERSKMLELIEKLLLKAV
jgi:transcriptional regulator with XRE-family HTH domain